MNECNEFADQSFHFLALPRSLLNQKPSKQEDVSQVDVNEDEEGDDDPTAPPDDAGVDDEEHKCERRMNR